MSAVSVLEPATEEVMAELPRAGVAETDTAVARARDAFPAWRRVQPGERAALMRSVAAAVRDRAEELARLEARNVGKPISDARGEVGMVADVFDYYAGELERIAVEAGVPEGVFNVVVGSGRVVGERLVEHPDVAKIAFTGSTEVGRGVMKGAAESIKRVTLELGGKSANVVFADADLEAAAGGAPYAVFGNAGQDCCARSRILVEESAYDSFMDLLVRATEGVKVGDPESADTEMGPLVSAEQRESVSSYVDGNVAYQ